MGHTRKMSPQQRERLGVLLSSSVPELSFLEAESAIQASGTLLQGIHAAFEPFLRAPRINHPTPVDEDGRNLPEVLEIEVDYRKESTIKHLLQAGSYDWTNEDVSDDHFPQKKMGRVTIRIRLICFDQVISSREVLARLRKEGLRPANPAELLALGARYPSVQRQFPVIALGQTWLLPNGDRMVVCLAWHSMLRRVHLLCKFRRDWPAHCRFVAVKR